MKISLWIMLLCFGWGVTAHCQSNPRWMKKQFKQNTAALAREPDSVINARNRLQILRLEQELDSLALVYNKMQIDTYLAYSHITGDFPSYNYFHRRHIDSLWQYDKTVLKAGEDFSRADRVLQAILDSVGFRESMAGEERSLFFDSLARVSKPYRQARQLRDEAHWCFQVAPLRALCDRYQAQKKILPVFFISNNTLQWMMVINPELDVMKERVERGKELLKSMYASEIRQVYNFQYIPTR